MMAAAMRTRFAIWCLCQIGAAVITRLIRAHPDERRPARVGRPPAGRFGSSGQSKAASQVIGDQYPAQSCSGFVVVTLRIQFHQASPRRLDTGGVDVASEEAPSRHKAREVRGHLVAERSFGCLRFEALQWDTATSPGDKREGR